MAIALAWAFKWEECLLVAGRGLQALGDRPSTGRAALLGLSGLIVSLAGTYGPGDQMTREAVELGEALDDQTALAAAYGVRAIHHWAYLELSDAVQLGTKAMALSRERGNLWNVADVGTFVAFAKQMMGDVDGARALVDELEEITASIGHIQAQNLVRRVRNLCTDYATAEEWAGVAGDDLELVRDLEGDWLHDSYAYLGMAAFRTGDWDLAIQHFRRSADEAARSAPWIWDAVYPALLVVALAYAGARDEALEILDRCQGDMPVAGQPTSLGSWGLLVAAGEALFLLGENARLADLYAPLQDGLATGARTGYATRLVVLVAAMSAAAGGDFEAAEKHLAEARAQAAGRRAMEIGDIDYFEARIRLLRDGAGDREEADRLLDHAIDTYGRLGMPRHVEMARELRGRVPA
jgi:tetratricopeptide (TPR) repeat protein